VSLRLDDRPSQERLVARIVRQARGVREQIADGDPVPIGQQAGKPPLDGVLQPEPMLRDELERDDRDEGLRDAAGAKAIPGAQRHPVVERGETARGRSSGAGAACVVAAGRRKAVAATRTDATIRTMARAYSPRGGASPSAPRAATRSGSRTGR
jgi:hypothetical protein